MPELSELGERRIVADLLKLFDPEGDLELGDDTGILDYGAEYILLTTDAVCARTHVPESAAPEDVGWYSAAINLSDIAAMGGRPLGMVFSLGLPGVLDVDYLDGLAAGIRDCCSEFNVPVLGGDTKENQGLTITGTALGTVPKSGILRRGGARPGDIVAMTGSLGRGVLWERDGNASQYLRFRPRLKEGRKLSESGAVTSCIDMSDGLSTSLHHLAKASQAGFRIDFQALKFVPGLNGAEKDAAMHFGGDYELLFTVRPDEAGNVFSPGGCGISKIGYVTEDISVSLEKDGELLDIENKGYEHFRVRE